MKMPIDVTRKTANGETGQIELSPYLVLFTFFLIYLNVLGWSIYGITQLIGKV